MMHRVARSFQLAMTMCAAGALAWGCATVEATDTAGQDASDATEDTDTANGVPECPVPQAPRDIATAGGSHPASVAGSPEAASWLCNVHFHDPEEHAGYGTCPEVEVDPMAGSGEGVCAGHGHAAEEGGARVGDVVEVHWVYSSCQAEDAPAPAPGQGLAACTCEGGQVLRVRAQVYVVDAVTGDEDLEGPPDGVALASFAGSTTGTSFDNATCSPVGVHWEVGTTCRALRRDALGAWCAGNPFGEDHGHGARALVEDEAWLSPYLPPAGSPRFARW